MQKKKKKKIKKIENKYACICTLFVIKYVRRKYCYIRIYVDIIKMLKKLGRGGSMMKNMKF